MDSLQIPVTQETITQSIQSQSALTVKKRVVIAGCGFGGLRVAEKLRNNCGDKIEIIAIDNADCHTFAPALYSVATGDTSANAVCEPLSVIFIRKGIKYYQEKIVELDVKNKTIKTKKMILINNGEASKKIKNKDNAINIIPYDFLVLAVGSEVNYYNIKGIQKNAFQLKTKEDAAAIYGHLRDVINSIGNKQLHRFVVLGGGVTGVELASELKDHLDMICKQNNIPQEKFVVMLVHALDQLMPGFPDRVRRFCEHYMADHDIVLKLNSPVIHAKDGLLVLKNGEVIKADTIIWAGGIKANKLLSKAKVEQDEYGIKVNSYLQSVSDANVYAVGDCMNYTDPKTNKAALKTAQNALSQAKVVAENICKAVNAANKAKNNEISKIDTDNGPNITEINKINNCNNIKYSKYMPKETPVLISLGKNMGLFVWKSFWFRGYWMMKAKDYIEKEYMWKIRL